MNYETRIESMLSSGMIDEKEAQSLRTSLQSDSETGSVPVPKRSWRFECIGVVLLTGVLLLFWAISGLHDTVPAVEQVGKSLNAPVQSGIGTFSMFWIILLLCMVSAYLILYLLARISYGSLWQTAGRMAFLKEKEHHILLMQKALESHAEKLAEENKTEEEEIVVRIDSKKGGVPIWQLKLEEELLENRNEMARLKEICKRKCIGISGALAGLIGILPECKE